MNSIWLTGLVAGVISLGAGITATHALDANHYGAIIAQDKTALAGEKLAHTNDLKAVSDKATKAAADALMVQHGMEFQLAALDKLHTKELDDAKAQNEKLAADVAAGTVRLRVAVAAARAPTSSDGVPQTAAPTGVDTTATVELAPSARQAYFEVAGGIAADQTKILALQDYVKNVCLAAPVSDTGAVP